MQFHHTLFIQNAQNNNVLSFICPTNENVNRICYFFFSVLFYIAKQLIKRGLANAFIQNRTNCRDNVAFNVCLMKCTIIRL